MPLLPVLIQSRSKGTTAETFALIDTGAEVTLLCSTINRHKLLHSDRDRKLTCGRVLSKSVTSALLGLGQISGFEFPVRVSLRREEPAVPIPPFAGGIILRLIVREFQFRQQLPYRMILGRDALRRLLFTYDGPAGEFSIER